VNETAKAAAEFLAKLVEAEMARRAAAGWKPEGK
jgi:hypothetical protein